jgi:hypothetical protein
LINKDENSSVPVEEDLFVSPNSNNIPLMIIMEHNYTYSHHRQWKEFFQSLQEFKTEHGHCNVPITYSEDPDLGHWVYKQRKRRKELTVYQRLSLDDIGFDWGPQDAKWLARFAELQQFRQEHGHWRVPVHWKEHPGLRRWVQSQRRLKAAGRLDPVHEAKLNRVQFDWTVRERKKKKGEKTAMGKKIRRERPLLDKTAYDVAPQEDRWRDRFAELEQFEQEHGHCRVPVHWKESPELGRWVHIQRYLKAKGRMDPVHEAKLNQIQFDWTVDESKEQANKKLPVTNKKTRQERLSSDEMGVDRGGVREAKWGARISQLERFHEEHGHWRVPRGSKEHFGLHKWIYYQRLRKSTGRLDPVHEAKLNQIHFDWTIKERKKQAKKKQSATDEKIQDEMTIDASCKNGQLAIITDATAIEKATPLSLVEQEAELDETTVVSSDFTGDKDPRLPTVADLSRFILKAIHDLAIEKLKKEAAEKLNSPVLYEPLSSTRNE